MVETFKIKKDDTVPAIEATLQFANGSPVNLTGAAVYFNIGNLTDFSAYRSGLAVITNGSTTGQVKYAWNALDTGSVGQFWGEFEANWGSGSIMTLPTNHGLRVTVIEDYN